MKLHRSGACALLALACAAPALADPIPEGPGADSLPKFKGSPATPAPVYAPDPPRHPHMAPNGRSNIHDDAFMTDTYQGSGPLGNGTTRLSNAQFRECASLTFDAKDRIVAVCVGLDAPKLLMFDPKTLDPLAQMNLPPRRPGATTSPFTDFSGGGYFYLDDKDRAILPTTERHIYVVRETPDPGFAIEHDYDLTSVVPDQDKIISTLPDYEGRVWFASSNGVVGWIDPADGSIKSMDTKEPNGNSFAVDDSGGVYIVTDKALYRFDAGPSGPVVTWREAYDNIGQKKPGQTQAGSGTTPTVMGRDYVAITDNADPMNVVVYKRAPTVSGSRLVCKQPVFEKGASDTDQSLIATANEIIVSNNYGYSVTAVEQGGTTTPGIERVDLDDKGCHKAWHSDEIAPSSVNKLSLGNGLVYAYTKDPQPDNSDAWYLTAMDFATGKTVFKALGGEGLGFNNNYAPVTLGPDGTAYVGVLGGLLALRDASPPAGGQGKPRVRLNARRFRDGRVRLSIGGFHRSLVKRADYRAGKRRLGGASSSPFRRIVRRKRIGRSRKLSATVTMIDGRRVTLSRRTPR